jgi:type IV pilus assembly protein PilB
MAVADAQLKEILLKQNYLSAEDVDRAEQESKERDVTLKQALIELELLTEDLYENAIAEHYGLAYFDPEKTEISPDVITALPEQIARTMNCVVVQRPGATQVVIATSDPSNPDLEEAVRMNLDQTEPLFTTETKGGKKKSKKPETRAKFTGTISWIYASQAVIERLFTHYRKPLDTRFQQIIEEQKKVAPEILQEIFNDAIQMNASDIHFEPQEQMVIVRFRVDGVLHEAGRIPKEYYEGVLNRIKIASNMHIDEHFAAQDGAIRYKAPSGMKVDMRVSVVPVVDGEKVVMRLLSEYVRKLTLGTLGFSDENRQTLEAASQKPFGMILTVGPTGSGKSTTLYALLKLRNKPDVNISTVEDPVEYKIPGINHIQKNDETNLTFANGLRALMRQDPDIMLVGEIRDSETADISVNAALTGHLLFSTLHANTAATAVPRLLEMGVEPFLLASTLEVIIGQRLVRRVCAKCRYSYAITGEEVRKLFPAAKQFFSGKEKMRLFKGKGCPSCSGTGYAGRIAIHELLAMSPEIQEMVTSRKTSRDIEQLARRQGMKLMFEDGLEKVRQGFTTLEELMRVAAPPLEVIKPDRAKKSKNDKRDK